MWTRYDIAQSGQQEIPNTSLKPEKFISYEVGLKLRKPKWQAQTSVFYTTVQDMIMRYPTGNMIGANYEVQKANIGDGYIQGFEARADYQLDEQWSLFSGLAAVYGEADTYPTSAQIKDTEPMNKLQPLQGILGARWQDNKYRFEVLVKAADRQDKLSAEDKLDTQRIPPKGTPGYAVINLRGGLNVNQHAQLSMAIENIANRDYRIHGSGTNEPGTNFIMAIDGKF
ncbi:MAG: TonB-dependent receptor [Planctomycetes bacterium]|nr:TonB-dependent receptor [Planctomycetota bacterium]